jgi:hypothetical protein
MRFLGSQLIQPILIQGLASKTSDQVIENTGAEVLTWDQVERDDAGFFDLVSDNTAVMIPSNIDFIDVITQVRWDVQGSTGREEVRILKNNSNLSPQRRVVFPNSTSSLNNEPTMQVIAWNIDVTSSDVINIEVIQNSSGDINVIGDEDRTWVYVRGTFGRRV